MLFHHRAIALSLLIFLLLLQNSLKSQTRGVILDKETHKPIPYVCIYAKSGKTVLGAMSNELGEFNVNFPTDSIFFSHVNYLKLGLLKKDIPATIYLQANSVILPEIIVGNKQPKWISLVLKEVVKQRTKNYSQLSEQMKYSYETSTLSDSSGYAFKSKGDLLVPSLLKDGNYYVSCSENVIKYKDTTAGPDFGNLKRILYNDFIKDFNNDFISKNDFTFNYWPENKDNNLVLLGFTSKKYKEDKGFVVVDTLNKAIVEFEQNAGTEYNIKAHTTFILRNAAATLKGFRYVTWVTKMNGKFLKNENGYIPSEFKYKIYVKASQTTKGINSNLFSSLEAVAHLNKTINSKKIIWHILPKPVYIYVETKKMKQEEEELKKEPTKFERF